MKCAHKTHLLDGEATISQEKKNLIVSPLAGLAKWPCVTALGTTIGSYFPSRSESQQQQQQQPKKLAMRHSFNAAKRRKKVACSFARKRKAPLSLSRSSEKEKFLTEKGRGRKEGWKKERKKETFHFVSMLSNTIFVLSGAP